MQIRLTVLSLAFSYAKKGRFIWAMMYLGDSLFFKQSENVKASCPVMMRLGNATVDNNLEISRFFTFLARKMVATTGPTIPWRELNKAVKTPT